MYNTVSFILRTSPYSQIFSSIISALCRVILSSLPGHVQRSVDSYVCMQLIVSRMRRVKIALIRVRTHATHSFENAMG
jgi:hypothetical protein